MSFAENQCGSSLTSWLIVDTLLISKLFAPFVPICSQLGLCICYLGEFVKNKTSRFQCFPVNDIIIKSVYTLQAECQGEGGGGDSLFRVLVIEKSQHITGTCVNLLFHKNSSSLPCTGPFHTVHTQWPTLHQFHKKLDCEVHSKVLKYWNNFLTRQQLCEIFA